MEQQTPTMKDRQTALLSDDPGRFEQKFYGHHGGLTPGEMEIPLLMYAF